MGHATSGGHVIASKTLAGQNHIYHVFDDPDPEDDMAYEYQEYPKHVTVNGTLHVCNSLEEEEAVTAGGEIVREADERKRLVALAGVNGVQVDGRWSVERLSNAITDAGFDATANPFA